MLFRRVLIGIESLKSTSMIVRSVAAGILAVLLMLSNLISAGAVELSTGDASTDILSSADPSAGDLSVGDSSPECSVDISIEATQASVSAVTGLAASLAESAPFGSTSGGFSWDTEGKSRSWTYYNGIMMDAFLMLDSGYTGRVEQFYSANIGTRKITRKINNVYRDCGYVDNTGASDNYYRPDELDSMPPVRALFDLIRSGSANSSKYIRMIEYVYTLMQESSWVISNTGGNYIHKRNNSNWTTYQIALDGLYMAQPFFMELAKAKDEGMFNSGSILSNLDSDAVYNEVCSRMLWIGNNLYDSDTKLYNHGYNPATVLGNGHYWSRAIGWYAAALADVISMLPDAYSSQKAALIAIAQQLFDGMMEYRDVDTGMWYNVTNRDAAIGDNRLESSGTALVAYAMMKLYTEGYVDDIYGKVGLEAFNGTVSNKLIGGQLIDVYRSAGVETTDAGYVKNPYTVNEAKGAGPLIMASCYANTAAEMYQASHLSQDYRYSVSEDGKTIIADNGSGSEPLTLTISAPADLTYDGSPKEATLNDYDTTAFPGEYIIVYTRDGTAMDSAPVNVGTYIASVTVGEGEDAVTAGVEYAITPKSIADAVITPDNIELTYNGSEQSVTVTKVEIDDFTLEEDDYEVTGNTGTNAGVYTLAITGRGNYKDTATYEWRIAPINVIVSATDFVLPSKVEVIEPDAFNGDAMEVAVIPSGCRTIGANAFANCRHLTQIRIPDTVETIEDSAFDGCGTVFVFGTSGSAAEKYCEEHTGCIFVSEENGSFVTP